MQGPFHLRKRTIFLALALALAAASALLPFAGCTRLRPATVPLRTVRYPGAGSPRTLVVLLPGRSDVPEDFGRRGFPARAAAAGLDVDMIAVDAHLAYYYNGTIVDRLREDVIGPARRRYDHIWLAGISIGGTGALLYASQHSEDVDGLVVLAPFLGDDKVIAEIAKAGGPRAWSPAAPLPADDFQHRLWVWLRQLGEAGKPPLPIFLGYGRSDSFARANGMMGTLLDPARLFTAPGGHAWKAWNDLWDQVLRAGAFR